MSKLTIALHKSVPKALCAIAALLSLAAFTPESRAGQVTDSATCVKYADGRETYGHSLVADPWGEVLAEMDEAPGLAFVDIDLQRIAEVRARIPVLAHRRAIGRID